MGKLKSLVLGMLLGAGGMYAGLQYHVLHAEEGMLIVPRVPQQRIQDSYADIRKWDGGTWTARPRVALAVAEYGRSDLITDGVSSSLLDDLRQSIAPLQEDLGQSSSGWEPSKTTGTPAHRHNRAGAVPPSRTGTSPARRGFLPLADLFGVGSDARPTANDQAITPVLPAGVVLPKPVEILPPPDEVEILSGPDDVYLGPSAPIPGRRYRGVDRRRTDATNGWEPVK